MFRGSVKVLATPSIRQFTPHFPSVCHRVPSLFNWSLQETVKNWSVDRHASYRYANSAPCLCFRGPPGCHVPRASQYSRLPITQCLGSPSASTGLDTGGGHIASPSVTTTGQSPVSESVWVNYRHVTFTPHPQVSSTYQCTKETFRIFKHLPNSKWLSVGGFEKQHFHVTKFKTDRTEVLRTSSYVNSNCILKTPQTLIIFRTRRGSWPLFLFHPSSWQISVWNQAVT
jgi:hypothetical protein